MRTSIEYSCGHSVIIDPQNVKRVQGKRKIPQKNTI